MTLRRTAPAPSLTLCQTEWVYIYIDSFTRCFHPKPLIQGRQKFNPGISRSSGSCSRVQQVALWQFWDLNSQLPTNLIPELFYNTPLRVEESQQFYYSYNSIIATSIAQQYTVCNNILLTVDQNFITMLFQHAIVFILHVNGVTLHTYHSKRSVYHLVLLIIIHISFPLVLLAMHFVFVY